MQWIFFHICEIRWSFCPLPGMTNSVSFGSKKRKNMKPGLNNPDKHKKQDKGKIIEIVVQK